MSTISDNSNLIIQGIAKRASVRKLVSQSKGNQFRVKVRIFSPFYFLSPQQDSQNIQEKVSLRQAVRTNILRISRHPSLLLPIGRVGFELQFSCSEQNPLSKRKLEEMLEVNNLNLYTSREVAKYGFPTTSIDNTLEYELSRNWATYDLILTRAKISITHKNISNLIASKQLSVEEKQNILDQLLQDHYFTEFLSVSLPENHLDDSRSLTGKARIIEHLPHTNGYTDLWKLIHLQNATILHGKVVFSGNEFYLGDRMKIPTFGSSYNQWPGNIFQNRTGAYFSPKGKYVGQTLEEAIFVGGTKNIMHFVIEDLPRIFLPDDFGISESAPLVVAKTLGPQILSLIEMLSRRRVIQLDSFEMLSVQNLYILDFNNPLVATMSGDRSAAAMLFSTSILKRARNGFRSLKVTEPFPQKRIFIRRERGLFRPLINARLIQWMLEHIFEFETYFLADKSLEEIHQIFSGAEIIVAEYGAALANVIFVDKPCKVIEIRGAAESSAIEYETLIGILGHEHYIARGNAKKVSRYGIARGPYKINVMSLRRIILSMT